MFDACALYPAELVIDVADGQTVLPCSESTGSLRYNSLSHLLALWF